MTGERVNISAANYSEPRPVFIIHLHLWENALHLELKIVFPKGNLASFRAELEANAAADFVTIESHCDLPCFILDQEVEAR